MAITYPLAFPSPHLAEISVEEVNIDSDDASLFTGKQFIQEYDGEFWRVTIRMPQFDHYRGAMPVLAFMSALNGRVGTFVLPHPAHASSLGTAKDVPSTPVVEGSGQVGRSINISQAPADQEGWLLAGDIIQIGPDNRPHWHRVLADVDTDAEGLATIDIWPSVRFGTLDGDAVKYENPLCLFRLSANARHDIRKPLRYDIPIEAREVLP